MEKSSFFNAELVGENWDRTYTAEDYANYFGSFVSNGVFPNPNTNLEVVANNNMSLILKPGKAWINGYFYHNDNDLSLNVDPADGVLKRIDRIVIRLDHVNREMKAYVKKGAFASVPVAPTLQRDSDCYELGIADVTINNGAISIIQSDILDTRLQENLCGMVNSLIKVDSAILTDKLEADFYNWLDSLSGLLEGDAAANLSNEIVLIKQRLDSLTLSGANVTLVDAENNFIDNTVEGALKELSDKTKNYVKSWVGTQVQYDAIEVKDSATMYYVLKG